METSDLVLLKKWLQSNKNFTYSFYEFFLFNKLCKFHSLLFYFINQSNYHETFQNPRYFSIIAGFFS